MICITPVSDHSNDLIEEISSVLPLRSSLIPYPVASVNPRASSSVVIIVQESTSPPPDLRLTISADPSHLLSLSLSQACHLR